jgi:hypothetical protein
MQRGYCFLPAVLVITVMFGADAHGQWWNRTPPPTVPVYTIMDIFREGMNVSATVDSFGQTWGINVERVQDAAQTGLKTAGWEFNPSSDRSISVVIDSFSRQNDSICTFTIDAGEFRRKIDVKKSATEGVSLAVTQVVFRIAHRLRAEIIQNKINRPDPNYVPAPDRW